MCARPHILSAHHRKMTLQHIAARCMLRSQLAHSCNSCRDNVCYMTISCCRYWGCNECTQLPRCHLARPYIVTHILLLGLGPSLPHVQPHEHVVPLAKSILVLSVCYQLSRFHAHVTCPVMSQCSRNAMDSLTSCSGVAIRLHVAAAARNCHQYA